MTKNNLEVANWEPQLLMIPFSKDWRTFRLQIAWISDYYLESFLPLRLGCQQKADTCKSVIGGSSCTTEYAITGFPRLKAEFVLLGQVELPHEMQKIVSWCFFSFFFFKKISLFYFRYRYTFPLHHVTLTYGCNKHIIIQRQFLILWQLLLYKWHSPNFHYCHISHRGSCPLFCGY